MNLKDRPDVSPGELRDIVENALNGLKVFNLLNISIELDIFDFLNKQMTYK